MKKVDQESQSLGQDFNSELPKIQSRKTSHSIVKPGSVSLLLGELVFKFNIVFILLLPPLPHAVSTDFPVTVSIKENNV
jgi:hypothetical protein